MTDKVPVMIRNEIVSGILWHLECMVLAATAIENFRPPADLFVRIQ